MNLLAGLPSMLLIAAVAWCSACRADIGNGVMELPPEQAAWLEAHGSALSFAPDPFYAPFEFLDPADGRTKGLAHEYLVLVERKLGVRFRRIGAASFGDILDMAKDGRVDVVNAATPTPERAEYLLFTEPLIEVKNVMLTRKSDTRVSRPEDLSGLRVSVPRGYAVAEYLADSLEGVALDETETDLQALLNVAYGLSDAAVLDLATASFLTAREGLPTIRVAGDVGYPVRLCIGSRKDLPELHRILAGAVAAITPEEREAIQRRWINLSEEGAMSRKQFLLAVFILGLGMIGILGGALVWNHQLKRQIAARTAHLDKALAERETPLRELLHRTGNNLQLITSLIDLRYGDSLNTESGEGLRELQACIHSMALVQQRLYESNDLSSIDLGRYVVDVSRHLVQSAAIAPGKVRLSFDVKPVLILFDVAIPCGLVLTELVTNALRHAFPGDRRGTVAVRVAQADGDLLEIAVADDGIGPPPGHDLAEAGSMGLLMAVSIVRHQLGGTIEFIPDNGLTCVIRFSAEKYRARI